MPKDSDDFALDPVVIRSPSGLFTKGAWRRDMSSCADWNGPVPGSESDIQFGLWVHERAKMLASHLDRLIQPDTADNLASKIRAVADVLWADAEWARRHCDGSLSDLH